MFGLETIKAMNREAGEKAREQGLEPFHLEHESQLDLMPPFPFPNIGDKSAEVSEQHEHIEDLFCDKGGWGADDEPALTIAQLVGKLRALLRENQETGLRLAIIEEGQFQLYIGVWR
tara:strand:+ start:1111 stop:1461 length:351 start_codon:yes stop_codon:yes gene_type:complete